MTSPENYTVSVLQLTRRLGLPDDKMSDVALWAKVDPAAMLSERFAVELELIWAETCSTHSVHLCQDEDCADEYPGSDDRNPV